MIEDLKPTTPDEAAAARLIVIGEIDAVRAGTVYLPAVVLAKLVAIEPREGEVPETEGDRIERACEAFYAAHQSGFTPVEERANITIQIGRLAWVAADQSLVKYVARARMIYDWARQELGIDIDPEEWRPPDPDIHIGFEIEA